MKNLLKTISLILLTSLSQYSYGEEIEFNYDENIIEYPLISEMNYVIAYNNSEHYFSQNKEIRSCKLNNKTACLIYKYLKNNTTFKDFQIYAIICSAYRESTLNPKAGNSQYGLFQWNHARERLYRKVFKRSLRNTTITQQLEFFIWELKHTENIAYKALLKSNNFEQASIAMVKKFERSLHQQSDINKQRRIYKQLLA